MRLHDPLGVRPRVRPPLCAPYCRALNCCTPWKPAKGVAEIAAPRALIESCLVAGCSSHGFFSCLGHEDLPHQVVFLGEWCANCRNLRKSNKIRTTPSFALAMLIVNFVGVVRGFRCLTHGHRRFSLRLHTSYSQRLAGLR